MEVTVTQGSVTVTSVDLIYDTPDIKILEIHTDQKYPVQGGYASGMYQCIWPAEWETRKDYNVTTVQFDFDRGKEHWAQTCDTDRYHLTVTLFRYHLDHDHRTEIFSSRGDS